MLIAKGGNQVTGRCCAAAILSYFFFLQVYQVSLPCYEAVLRTNKSFKALLTCGKQLAFNL